MKRIIAIVISLFMVSVAVQAQDAGIKSFTNDKVLPHTAIKDQGASGTCWSFCTISLIESELMRQGKGTWQLSEMFPVYHCYIERAVIFLRTSGYNNFGQGGIDNDVFWVIGEHGILRDEDYSGMWPGESRINHSELARGLKAFLTGITKGKVISAKWRQGFTALLNTYMTAPPEFITIDGKEMTPGEFAAYLEIDADDYIGITSFLHLPLYQQSELYLPDNWMHHSNIYNVPLEEFIDVIDTALERGFTVSIGADVSEDSWHSKLAYAVWKEGEEITAEEREKMWDSWRTTDDHGMHIVGLATDENGNRFYYTKNSWGADHGPYGGYDYISPNYLRAKANSITIHKDALTPGMKEKLGIE